MRLNAYLAQAGVASRRKADALIKEGRVTVNGHAGQLNTTIKASDQVKIDGHVVASHAERYILLNKPAGYVTTLKDEKGRHKVIDLIKISERVIPVGRLDYNTTGALLLTNDGQLAHKLMHPKHEVDKTYDVVVEGEITPKILNMLSTGVELSDGVTAPAKAKRLSEYRLELKIHEGRNRQVRRMMAAVGLRVKTLHRSAYGSISLRGLKTGHWRELSPAEVKKLRS